MKQTLVAGIIQLPGFSAISMYLIPVALLVFFCYHLDAEGSKGDYTQVRKDNYEDLGYSGIVEFVNGKNDV